MLIKASVPICVSMGTGNSLGYTLIYNGILPIPWLRTHAPQRNRTMDMKYRPYRPTLWGIQEDNSLYEPHQSSFTTTK